MDLNNQVILQTLYIQQCWAHFTKKAGNASKTQVGEGLIGVRAAILARTPGLPNLQVELVLLVAPHIRVGHEVERVAGESK